MADQNSYRRANTCGPSQRPNPPSRDVNPWDNEPTWPGTEYDDDEAVADGMCDDDNDAPWPWMSAVLGSPQPSLWDEAISKIFASKSRSDSF